MDVIEAIITGLVAIIVCMINNVYQQRRTREQNSAQHAETTAMMDYKLSELTKRVDKHNNVIERTYRLEEQAAVLDEKIKVANHRIEDLEGKGRIDYEKH